MKQHICIQLLIAEQCETWDSTTQLGQTCSYKYSTLDQVVNIIQISHPQLTHTDATGFENHDTGHRHQRDYAV